MRTCRGSFALSRLANYYPEMISKLAFIDIGYSAPGHGLSLQAIKYINQSVEAAMGYGVFGYFLFFKEADAAELMNKHVCISLPLWSGWISGE